MSAPSLSSQFRLVQPSSPNSAEQALAQGLVRCLEQLDGMAEGLLWLFDYRDERFLHIGRKGPFFRDNPEGPANGYSLFLRETHPDDVLFLLAVHKAAADFLDQLPDPALATGYKFVYAIRLRHVSGGYSWLRQQVKIVATDTAGKVWLSLGMAHELPEAEHFQPYVENAASGERFGLGERFANKRNFEKPQLSRREQELLELLATDTRQEEAARRMGICLNTLKNHRKNLYLKLHATNRREALRQAFLLGLR